MDHVIKDMQKWLDIYLETEPDNKKAIKCIENALTELYKYYPQTKDAYGNPIK